ncbi:retrovirus-related Pol polyprotein from transposon 297 [Trichonephila clavipes]|nr:retrovirus-related Pol polyprotein from transposon 297 [Trichonephila clavipes]
MTGWYQKFIPRYADICEPLYQLKKKGAKFNWSGEAQDSFDQIKRTLTEAPILQLPNFSEQFNLFTDASGVGIGAVLQQNQKPIAFASRTLNKAERNYTVTEREMFGEIANDQKMDEELLARGFRAPFPATRKLNFSYDKVYVIFKTYITLKNTSCLTLELKFNRKVHPLSIGFWNAHGLRPSSFKKEAFFQNKILNCVWSKKLNSNKVKYL